MADQFCAALLREFEELLQEREVALETIYFGGGTPTALSTRQLEFLLLGLAARTDLSRLAEWTVEANPGSVSAGKAELLRRRGVTRISLGVQSWTDRLLRLLGREHDAAKARESYELLRAVGFNTISIDLMFGLPTQSLDEWEESLRATVALGPDHISTYCLTYEEDTDFFLRHARGEFRIDEASDAAFFTRSIALLEGAGYQHYETSNYARPGHRSKHNQGYWRGDDYLGLGPSAVSTAGMERWKNVADYRCYTEGVLACGRPARELERLTSAAKHTERVALSLRTSDGVPLDWTAGNVAARDEFISLGLWRQEGERLVLTNKGKLLADSVAEAFV